MSRTTTIGLHTRTVLANLFRHGALPVSQLVRITGLSESAVHRQLRYLDGAGYLARARDASKWTPSSPGRPKTVYYLTVPHGAKAGARELGIENDFLSLRHYRRCGLPAAASHRVLGNEYLLTVSEAGGDEVPEDEIYSESCPEFPLFGSGVAKTERADSPYRFARIVPDGVFEVCGYRYLLEVETKPYGRPELVSKFSDHAGRWRRKLRPNIGERKHHDAAATLEPVIILTPTVEHKRMRDYLRKHLPDSEDWSAGDEAIREASEGNAEAGQLIIVAGIEEVRGNPLGRVYRPLYKYPPEHSSPSPSGVPGWRVSLKDAAEISARIPVPAKPPKLATTKKKLTKKKEKGAA